MAKANPVIDDATRASLRALHRYATAPSPDTVFLDDMQQRVDAARPLPRRRDGTLRILLLGYAGAANTGADLRVIETIVQMRALFGARADIRLFALGECFDHPVLNSVARLVPALPYLPDALDTAIRDADVVINAEGSTYTSKFSDSLAGILIGGIALAAALGRVAIAYGVDSGGMSPALQDFVRRNAKLGHVITRNEAARRDLQALGVDSFAGADTAWTYRANVDATSPRRVALCPNNPYWWPVEADAARALALDARGEVSPLRYGPLHFHRWDERRAASFEAYLDRFARIAIGHRERGYEPVIVGMEQLDGAACEALAARLPFKVDQLVRGAASLAQVTHAVCNARHVVSTRYHAVVLALSHGVPAFGLSMDTRIDRLLTEAGIVGWHASCDACDADVLALAAIDSLDTSGAYETRVAQLREFAGSQRVIFHSMGTRLAHWLDA